MSGDGSSTQLLVTAAGVAAAAGLVGYMIGRRHRASTFRAFNFSPGPGALSDAVMARSQAEWTNFQGTGMGIIETTNLDATGPTHAGVAKQPVQQMMLDTETKLRTALSIPASYRVLFMLGGAVGQFSAVPLNLLNGNSKCDIVDVGFWSTRAKAEAEKYCEVHVPAKCQKTIPPVSQWQVSSDAAYVHICLNETVEGLEFLEDPDWDDERPILVADATSTLLSRPINVAKYGCIYASGGKNLPAGMAVVIIREELLKLPVHPLCPQIMDYRLNGGGWLPTSSVFESKPNTPPTFPVYMLGLVLDDIESKGGLNGMQIQSVARAEAIYNLIDTSGGFFSNSNDSKYRSRMNIPFRIRGGNKIMETKFLEEAEAAGLHYLFGHPVKGGIRATMYVGLEQAAVDALLAHMATFAKKYSQVF